MLLIITSNSDKLFHGVNIDDLQISRVNCDEMGGDRPRVQDNLQTGTVITVLLYIRAEGVLCTVLLSCMIVAQIICKL